MCTFNINVEPDNRLFQELGKSNYDELDSISELIDNSLAAKVDGKRINIDITIEFSEKENKAISLTIKDDGQGIKRSLLSKALSPAAIAGDSKMNEHGFGLKQAVASLGKFLYLKTKTSDIDYEMCVEELKFGKVQVKKNKNIKYKSGTEIRIEEIGDMIPKSKTSYTTNFAPKLGARYRDYLKPNNKKANITIYLKNIDKNEQGKYIDEEISDWNIEEIKPVYFHKNKRTNEPMVFNKPFQSDDWLATLTYGYAPTENEYKELGLELPKEYDPYHVSLNKQGLDIIKNDRVISFHQLFEIGLVNKPHPRHNYIRGEIRLIKGFQTAITKNSIIRDKNFNELIREIKFFLDEEGLLEGKLNPNKLPEPLLQKRLKNLLKTTTIPGLKKEKVETEYSIGGLGGRVDILADNELWEIKTNQANGLNIYELFAYMDMGSFDEGFFLAESFTTGAEAAKNHINKNHNKKIRLIPIKDLPINYPLSPDEIDKYM